MTIANLRFCSVLYLQSFKKDGIPVRNEEDTYGMVDAYIERQRLFGKKLRDFSPPALSEEPLRQYLAIDDVEGQDMTAFNQVMRRDDLPKPFSAEYQALFAPFIARARAVELTVTMDTDCEVKHYRTRPLTQK